MVNATHNDALEAIAIVGMAGRFPDAKNIEEFWQNLQSGVESISLFTDEEVISDGIDPNILSDRNYVKASAILKDIDLFDAAFFSFNPKEAEITDPQHRIFLECASVALENAGYDSNRCDSRIGVYAGASLNNYYSLDLNRDRLGSVQCYQTVIGNDKDFLTTRVSYKLNLTGPSITVQTACSTSLVATTLACQSLLNYQCDMALAGGVSIHVPQKTGYLYEPGGTLSPDGHCRAFDAKAQGTTIGNGVGIIVLKRLSDALADGDCIHAVIKGSAINNDGSGKVGYTAPSVNGQAEVIAEAMMLAGVQPETINYIEAHGTGTALGDPIEIAALSQVFRSSTTKKGFCAIASVKTNIGHLDAAAGIAGLIKTVLALKHQQIPPSLNFEQPNPQIDFANSPFYVNTKLAEWKAGSTPRRAGVSSLGIGGTNAHVILEEAPLLEQSRSSRPWQLLVLSAKTESALETATENLANHLQLHPDVNLADVAHTLQVGRGEFNHRRVLVCQNIEDATSALRDPQRVLTRSVENGVHVGAASRREVTPQEYRPIVFMFPGQGAQYVDMGKELYQTEPIFQEQVDLCCQLLQPHLGLDLRSLIYPNESESKVAAEKLQQTDITQPALFVIEYALAQLWMSWGISPQAMIGHSIGEYVAACLAGVMSVEDALRLVAARGRLMQQLPAGAMLSIPLPEVEVRDLLNEKLSLAASNAPALCVVSGTDDAINALQNQLQGIECRRLHTSHAFHSPMMEPILEAFEKEVSKVRLNPPKMPFISNVTGTWITAEQAKDPNYWVKHLRSCVRFSEGISALLQEPNRILLEVGPGHTLSTFAKKHSEPIALSSLRHPQEKHSDVGFLLNTLGKLWLSGVNVDWSGFYAHERRHRLPLPTYPFERQRYWIHDQKPAATVKTSVQKPVTSLPGKKLDIANWFYVPSWKRSPLPEKPKSEKSVLACTLVFTDECGLGEELVKRLKLEGRDAIAVSVGSQLRKLSDRHYTLNPQQRDDYDTLLKELIAQNKFPNTIVHLWNVTPVDNAQLNPAVVDKVQDLGFNSLLFLAQVLGKHNLTEQLHIAVISNNMQEVTGEEVLCPEKATIIGPVKVIPQEYPEISCRTIDVVIPSLVKTWQGEKLIDQLLNELEAQSSDLVIAYRGNHRWVQHFEPISLDKHSAKTIILKEKGVYLITGGLGGIGLTLAKHLAKTVQAKLLLVGRSEFPERDKWSEWLIHHDEQDSTSHKILKVQELEKLGAEVLVVSADVANHEQMLWAIQKAQEDFSNFNGVIHAAGVPGGGVIQRKTPEKTASILAPKVKGTLVLNSIFQDAQLDFFVLCSSMTAIQAEFGQVDYASANAFLDAFAHYKTNRDGVFTVSINWSAWQEVGMAAYAVKHSAQTLNISKPQFQVVNNPLFGESQDLVSTQVVVENKISHQQTVTSVFADNELNKQLAISANAYQRQLLQEGLLPAEGVEAFGHILANRFPQVIVSTHDLIPLKMNWVDGSPNFSNEQKSDKTQEVSLGKKPNIADWFYIPSWKRSLPPQSNGQVKQAERWLVFVDEYRLGAQIVKRLELEGHEVITVRIGEQFSSRSEFSEEQLGKCTYTIDPQKQDDYNTLLKELYVQDFTPNRIIHLWSVTQSELVDFNTAQEQGFHSLLFLAQALGKQNFTNELQLAVISNNMQAVTGVENLCPEKATVLGLLKVIPQEYSNVKCRSIDVTIPLPGSWQEEKFVEQLLTELKANSSDSVIAYRGLERWVQTFEPVQFDANVSKTPKLKEKGVYLITGGLEDIGLVIAEHLAKTVQAKLLILEAEDFPNQKDWLEWLTTHDEQDNISRKIRKVQELENLGAKVLIKSVDVVNLAQMQSAICEASSLWLIAQTQEQFDQLNGVFHTAKIPLENLFTPIAEIDPTQCKQQLQQKRQGLLVLEEVLQPQKLDFCLLMSSLTSVLGGLGSVGYSAASLLMDSLAYQHNQKNPVPWMSVNWDAWQFVTDNQQIFASTSLAEFAIQPQEGINALERILLWSQYHQIVVSTGNLQSRIDQWIKLEYLQEKGTVQQVNLSSRHSRPNLKNAYVAPSNDVDRKLVDIFQELLGIEPIGIHDNFFALGGDSLTGTVLISQVRKHFQIELPVRSLFEAPTVDELALVIEEILIEEIEQLSGNFERDKTLNVQLSN